MAKKVALFGSYGWGDGEWMRNWEAECLSLGANMVCECVICQETPDEEALAACEGAGQGAGGSVGRKNGMGGCSLWAAAVCVDFQFSPAPGSSTVRVATRRTKAMSCSTNRSVGWQRRMRSSICTRERASM